MKYAFLIFLALVTSSYAKASKKRTFLWIAPAVQSLNSFMPLDSNKGFGGSIGLGRELSHSLTLRLQLMYIQSRQDLGQSQASVTSGGSTYTATVSQVNGTQALGLTGGLQLFLTPSYTLSPYLTVDAGATYSRATTDLTVDSNPQNFSTDNGFSFIGLAGFGFNFTFSRSTSFFIEDSVGRSGSNNINFLKSGLEFSL